MLASTRVACMSAKEAEGSFFAILTQLGNVHKYEVEAVNNGLERTSSEALPTIHELVKELVTQHEREIQAVRVQLPVSLQKLNNEWVVDATTEPLWHIGDPCLPKKGGPEQKELEQLAEARRENNDMSNKAAASIKEEIQEQEVKMLKILNELKSSSWGPIEMDIRKRVCGHVRAMENGDVQLACLRKEQLTNIEQIRVAKVDIWRLQCHADSNEAISEVEIALRSGKNKMDKLEPTERRLRSHEECMEEDVTKALQKVQEIISQRAQLQAKCGTAQDDVWKVTYEEHDALIQLWKNTFEMLALSWKQSHVREKQLCIIEDRWKLLHVQTMLRRQEDAEKAAKVGDRAAMESLSARLEDLIVGFQNEAVSTKAKIAELLQQASEAQTQLRGFKHVQTVESDKVRDNFLLLSFIVMVEDVRLAWLRKEQLQAVDLTGLLRRALAESEDVPAPTTSHTLQSSVVPTAAPATYTTTSPVVAPGSIFVTPNMVPGSSFMGPSGGAHVTHSIPGNSNYMPSVTHSSACIAEASSPYVAQASGAQPATHLTVPQSVYPGPCATQFANPGHTAFFTSAASHGLYPQVVTNFAPLGSGHTVVGNAPQMTYSAGVSIEEPAVHVACSGRRITRSKNNAAASTAGTVFAVAHFSQGRQVANF